MPADCVGDGSLVHLAADKQFASIFFYDFFLAVHADARKHYFYSLWIFSLSLSLMAGFYRQTPGPVSGPRSALS